MQHHHEEITNQHLHEHLLKIQEQLLQLGTDNIHIKKQLKKMSQEMDDLKAKVENNGTVIGSAITLLQNIKARLDAAGTDPIALKQLSDDLGSQDQQLADAIVANTPTDPNA